jgi:hypothetical protein
MLPSSSLRQVPRSLAVGSHSPPAIDGWRAQ